MRIRSIKPEFWVSESVGRLTREARLLFIGLWSLADDSGRGRGALPAISGALFPYDVDAQSKLQGWFLELEREGMVRRYKCEDGNTYYDIPNWLKHQKIEKPSKSRFPEFTESYPNTPRILPDISPLDQGSGIRDQGAMEQGTGSEGGALKRAGRNVSATDDEFLAGLKSDPTYAGINIDVELGKCRRWCEANGKQPPTRRRLINWINHARPVSGGGGNGHQPSLRNSLICGSDEWDRQCAEKLARVQSGLEEEGFGVGRGPASQSQTASPVG